MRSHALYKPIVTKFCLLGRVVDVITDLKYLGIGYRVSKF